MKGRQNSIVAGEGVPYLLAALAAMVAASHFFGLVAAIPALVVAIYLFLVFRDPARPVPAMPLGVVSPVDGTVILVEVADTGVLGVPVQRIVLRVSSLGTYTARSPIEGKLMDVDNALCNRERAASAGGFWVQTDEGDDVVLQFSGYRFGLVPRAFRGYGERVGQGQRCAYLRLVRYAGVELPAAARVQVEPGQRVVAGSDVLARLPSSQ